jgi:ADP-ribosylglycohydrolase
MRKPAWLWVSTQDLRIEWEQSTDEGRDLSALEPEFMQLAGRDLENDADAQRRAHVLLLDVLRQPLRADYGPVEPDDLIEIRAARPAGPRVLEAGADHLEDRLLGAWLGRCAGCLLGKPFEGWRSDRQWGFLRATGSYPLTRYPSADVPATIAEEYRLDSTAAWPDRVERMPEDDDLNYTVLGLLVLERHGTGCHSEEIAQAWLEYLPALQAMTAERVAYRNLLNLIPPPASAFVTNPYREWIGATIRADIYGYASPGRPEQAAALAWRDARISHVKNGVYAAMWVAAMLAAATVEPDPGRLIATGSSEIPAASRLAAALGDVLAWHAEGLDLEAAIARVHARWDERNPHHWCHAIANAQIVALGLLWGEGDFARSICAAVQAGFDTDCNGATVGSVTGYRVGASALPGEWTAPLRGELETGLRGHSRLSLADLAMRTLRLLPPA